MFVYCLIVLLLLVIINIKLIECGTHLDELLLFNIVAIICGTGKGVACFHIIGDC